MKNSNTKFNLVKYVYGRCYGASLMNKPLVETRSKISQWKGVLKWLEKNEYIQNLKFNYEPELCSVTYNFNTQKVMYEYYLKGIKRNTELSITPMNEIIENNISEFEQERLDSFQNAVEYISVEDKIRRTMTNEEIYNIN